MSLNSIIHKLCLEIYNIKLHRQGFRDINLIGNYDPRYQGFIYSMTAVGPDSQLYGCQFTFTDDFRHMYESYPDQADHLIHDHLDEVVHSFVEALNGLCGAIPVAKGVKTLGEGVWVQRIFL